MNLKSRIAELCLGYTVNQIIVWGFDYGLYPIVIFWLGLGWGFVTMAFLSLLVCWLSIKCYDLLQRDWLGIEAIKSIKDYEGDNRAARWLAWTLRKSDPVACLLLSIKYDPFIVTVYLRRGRYGGMSARDWRNFLLSLFIGNAWWSVACFSGISAIEWVWKFIKSLIH